MDLPVNVSSFVKRHAIATYYMLVFGVSWGGGLLVLGPDGMVGIKPISPAQLPFVYLAALAGPALAGILCTALIGGRAGLRELRHRWFTWRVGVGWYAIALLTAPLLATAILFALSLTSPAFVPAIITSGDKAGLLLPALVLGVVVPLFEEMGWTGFAIPQLRTRHSIVTTGVIVGLLWGAWHFPLFAGSASSSGTIPPILYLAVLLFSWLPPYRVLMVWAYDHTHSVFLAWLMHLPIVVNAFVLSPAGIPEAVLTFDLAFGAALWVLVAAVSLRRQPRVIPQRGAALPA
jgi:membrane protease YdiL (CAAX protease family)